VGNGSLDQCLGVVSVRNLLAARIAGDPVDLRQLVQPPLYVAETARALAVLEQFKRTGVHIALVSDEFGGVEGLVTLNNLMEGIVGDLPSVDEQLSPQITTREDGSWLVDGSVGLERLKATLELDELPDEEEHSFHTVGGFAMHRLGRIPSVADHFETTGFRFEVVDMDRNRVDKLLVQRLPQSAVPATGDEA